MATVPTLGPQPDHLKVLSDFFGGADGQSSPLDVLANLSANGGGGADIRAGLDARRQQENELNTNLAADPRDARLQMLSKQMGLEDAANPDSDQNVEAAHLADTQAKQAASRTMLPDVRAAKVQAMTDAGTQAQDVARGTATGTAEGQYSTPGQAVADAASKRKIAEEIAPTQAMFGGSGGGGDILDQMATDLRNGKIQKTDIPTHMQDAVIARAAAGGGLHSPITNQSKSMGETAHVLLDAQPDGTPSRMDDLMGQAKNMYDMGEFDLVNSPIRQFLAAHGAGTLTGGGPESASRISGFETTLGLIQKEVQRALAGARGAAAASLQDQFQKLINAKGDYPTFVGQADALRKMLRASASIAGYQGDPSSDPYSDPNYQPK